MKRVKRKIKDFIGKDKKGRYWIAIKDKIKTKDILKEKEKRFCPPHRIPHTIPLIGKKIKDEECHIHTKLWRESHHIPFCKLIKCPNYNAMMNARKKFKQKLKSKKKD